MSSTLKAYIQKFLADTPHKTGETVQFGWLWFRIVNEGSPPEIETFDMKQMASFTTDFSEAERIHHEQWQMVTRFGVEPDDWSLMNTALVSKNYVPGQSKVFLRHDASSGGADSGWYVGIYDDSLDMDDVNSVDIRSLYELTIHDMRMAPYWLLPSGFMINLDTGKVEQASA